MDGGRGSGRAFLFVPDDVRLRHWASTIAEVRRHRLERRSDAETDEYQAPENEGLDRLRSEPDEQLSLFAVLSATATDTPPESIFDEDDDGPDDLDDEAGGDDERLTIDLGALPPAGPVIIGPRRGRKERDRLRQLNADLARELVVVTNRTHAAVNFELNRLSGVAKVSAATVDQLERRARVAEEWLGRRKRRARLDRFV